jgi:hypothetical protein
VDQGPYVFSGFSFDVFRLGNFAFGPQAEFGTAYRATTHFKGINENSGSTTNLFFLRAAAGLFVKGEW